jgi:hypothetical protein
LGCGNFQKDSQAPKSRYALVHDSSQTFLFDSETGKTWVYVPESGFQRVKTEGVDADFKAVETGSSNAKTVPIPPGAIIGCGDIFDRVAAEEKRNRGTKSKDPLGILGNDKR